MKKIIGKLANRMLQPLGYEIVSTHYKNTILAPGSPKRPVGKMDLLLEDLKVRGLNCRTILDVGANKTNWCRKAKKVYPVANLCLIEPQVEMKERLENFCAEFPGSVYFLVGAGARKERLILTIDEQFASSSLLPKSEEALIESGEQREIEITTIDNLIATSQMQLPELVKLDIQGFELEALKGGERLFAYTEVFILEVSLFPFTNTPDTPVLFEVIQFMLDRDYVVYDFPGFLRRPLDGALGQCDICFVKKNGFLRKSNDWE